MLARLGSSGADFLTGGGEAGALMRSMDWSASPLGHPRHWPQSLRTVVSLLLNSKFPMFVAWGPELGFLYNDPYSEILGAKHPAAMGRRFEDVWSDIWADIGPLASKAMEGEATFHEDLPLTMRRRGFEEQTYFTFSYSPVRDESGGIGGMFCACTETTKEVESRAILLANNEYLHSLFTQAPGIMAMVSGPEHVFELANDAYHALVGNRELIGKAVRDALPELAGQGFYELLDSVYATGEPFVGRQTPIVLQRRRGAEPETRYIDFIYQPVKDRQGRITGIFAEGHDVTDAKLTESALRESEQRFRTLADSAPALIWMSDETGQITFANRHYAELFGRPADDMQGTGWRDIVHPDDVDAFHAAFLDAFTHRRPTTLEVRVRVPSGDVRWLRCEGVPRFDDQGTFLGFAGCNIDITDAKQAYEHQRLLVNELNHRVKNTLATVQALSAQSFRDMDQMSRPRLASFQERLFALSRAHDVLTRENWDAAELREIITEVLDPYIRQSGGRFGINGPRLRLSPSMALALAMAVHELATNAAKYGALSVASGHVSINWSVIPGDPRYLMFRWEEAGGPPVSPPSRRGFGTRLIERTLASDLSGEVQLTYEPTGVVCTVTAPLANAETLAASAQPLQSQGK